MNTRAMLSLLMLFVLVFNQVAASIHIVEHAVPVAKPSLSTVVHEHSLTKATSGHTHTANQKKAFEPAESAGSCLFYHVLLATPGSLTHGMKTSTTVPRLLTQVALPTKAWTTTTINRVSIRGPPGIT